MKRFRLIWLPLLLALAMPSLANAASFEPGVVKVDGYDWSVSSNPVRVPLDQSGQTTYTVGDILETADAETSEFSLANVPGVEIIRPGIPIKYVRCTGNQVRAGNDACPRFQATADKTTMILQGGQRIEYTQTVPTIYITRQDDLKVVVSPASRKVTSGTSVKFTATVSGSTGSLSYAWDFGDGKTATTSGGSTSTVSHTFTGNDRTYNVVVTVSSTASPRSYTGLSVITVGKAPKKPKPSGNENQKEKEQNDGGDPGDGGYGSGLGGGYYGDGGGSGTGDPSGGSPGPPTPAPDQPKDKPPVADQPGETVTGQLIDPTATATVVPSTDTPGTGEAEAGPSDSGSGGGGGIPDGAKAALGIGALLGLGGLAEAGAFAGAFRRFRMRP